MFYEGALPVPRICFLSSLEMHAGEHEFKFKGKKCLAHYRDCLGTSVGAGLYLHMGCIRECVRARVSMHTHQKEKGLQYRKAH